MIKVGVLALQGAFREHIIAIEDCGAEAIAVKKIEQLDDIDGLVIPGGESTAIRRLIDRYDFMDSLKQFAIDGKPIFGTCAGLILLAKNLIGAKEPHIAVMDVTVERNSFGRQRESFEESLDIAGVADDYEAIFIRAPHIVQAGENVEVLAKHNERIVMAREGNLLACSFHPELTNDRRIISYFLKMIQETIV